MNEGEYKSTVTEVASWVWGVVQGGFNEQQTVAQIIVDAGIGCIPVVGDVTAVRDLIAVILRLVDEPEKREEVLQWVELVVLLFALIPVVGGVIKGVGKLLARAAKEAPALAKVFREVVALLNRMGHGDAIAFLRTLDFTKYTREITDKAIALFDRLRGTIEMIIRKASWALPEAMLSALRRISAGIEHLKQLAGKMIPEAIKELNERLKLMQRALYEGQWQAIPGTLKSRTRELEAHLVENVAEGAAKEGRGLRHPPSTLADFAPVEGWPDLRADKYLDDDGVPWVIRGFHGPIAARWLPPGTKIRRVLEWGPRSTVRGRWWLYQLPRDGRAWRNDYAVLERWSRNGAYVELIVPRGGLWAWEGKVASQLDGNAASKAVGQVLEGGATQLFIDFDHGSNTYAAATVDTLKKQPTNWKPSDHLGVSVPSREVQIEELGAYDVVPKTSPYRAVTRGTLVPVRASDDKE